MKRPITEPILRIAERVQKLTFSEMMDLGQAIHNDLGTILIKDQDAASVAMMLVELANDIVKAAAIEAEAKETDRFEYSASGIPMRLETKPINPKV